MTATASSELLIRAGVLYVPIVACIGLGLLRRPDRRRWGAVLVASFWNLAALFVLNLVAVRAGWWTFAADGITAAGIPFEAWLGWTLLWGTVPVLATTRVVPAAVLLVAVDLVLMPLCAPVVVLGDSWLIGEAVAVATCLVPGLLLGRWTARDEHLIGRAILQTIGFNTFVFFVVPTLVFTATGEGWDVLLARPRWHFVLAGIVLSPVAAMGIQAMCEFVRAGGTPVPLDPPKRLVTTGPYAYVANPMQLAIVVMLAGWGVMLASPAVVGTAVVAGPMFVGLADWSERSDLADRFGERWQRYRHEVRMWRPRWRPFVSDTATIYVAASCEQCSEVAGFLGRRHLTELEIVPAETCGDPLRRITYEHTGDRDSGIAAIGRALEHAHLAWAVASWICRIPLLGQVLQLVADASGAGPRDLTTNSPLQPSRPSLWKF